MKHCEFCNMELPDNAQFCGNCGRKIADRYATVTDFENPLEMGILERHTPPLFSSPQHPDLQDFRAGWQDTDFRSKPGGMLKVLNRLIRNSPRVILMRMMLSFLICFCQAY